MGELAEDVIEQGPGFMRAQLSEVGGKYDLTCSHLLVQAVGQCSGVGFYFRAKYGDWEFETEDEHGYPFPEGDPRRFARVHLRHGEAGSNEYRVGRPHSPTVPGRVVERPCLTRSGPGPLQSP
jgi:hypothetical protein